MKRFLFALLPLVAGTAAPAAAQERLEVVATIPDLGDLARQIGGDRVEVEVLVQPGSDPHAVIPKASLLLRLARADALILMGLDYEHAFLPALLEKSRNDRVRPGGEGYMNVGERVDPLEVPESLDRGAGTDLHPRGNPHFNLDPEYGRVMAAAVRDVLQRVDPEHAAGYRERWEDWDRRARARIARWKEWMEPLEGQPILSYHRSWSYFAARYGLELAGEVEPKPGVAPSARHLVGLQRELAGSGVRVLLIEPWYGRRRVSGLVKELELQVLEMPTTCGLTAETRTYLQFLDVLVRRVATAHGVDVAASEEDGAEASGPGERP